MFIYRHPLPNTYFELTLRLPTSLKVFKQLYLQRFIVTNTLQLPRTKYINNIIYIYYI